MQLRDFFEPQAIALPLRATAADAVLPELVGRLGLDQRASAGLLKVLQRREELGSTGVGRGIAIPHGRSLLVNRVRLSCDVRWQPASLPLDARYFGANPPGTTGAGYAELNGAKPLTQEWHVR